MTDEENENSKNTLRLGEAHSYNEVFHVQRKDEHSAEVIYNLHY